MPTLSIIQRAEKNLQNKKAHNKETKPAVVQEVVMLPLRDVMEQAPSRRGIPEEMDTDITER